MRWGRSGAHPSMVGGYLYALEPTPLDPATPSNPTPPPIILDPYNQTFTAKSTSYWDRHTNTAYAMGIKFKPLTPGPGPGSQCDRLIPIIDAKSNVTLNPNLPEGNVKDGKLDTMWVSKNTQNPSILLSLQDQKPVCRVDIAWADGNPRVYKFYIEVSMDAQQWVTGFTGQSTGNTTDYESYTLNGSQARYVRLNVTDSGIGTGNSQAQISEIRVFSNI